MDPREFLAQSRGLNVTSLSSIQNDQSRTSSIAYPTEYQAEESAFSTLESLINVSTFAMGLEEEQYKQRISTATASSINRQPAYGIPGGWTADEDRLLLLGVAACGVGRWTEIREDFLLERNSAQMNQRFTRLACRRSVLVEINSANGVQYDQPHESDEVKPKKVTPYQEEYKEVRTKYVKADEEKVTRSMLPGSVQQLLLDYNEDSIWESIAIRHLVDLQSKDKRCGRPQKYPLPIPIPKYMENGGWVNYRKLIINRPVHTPIVDANGRDGWRPRTSAASKSAKSSKRGRGRPRKAGQLDYGGDHKRTRVSVASVVAKEQAILAQQALHAQHSLQHSLLYEQSLQQQQKQPQQHIDIKDESSYSAASY